MAGLCLGRGALERGCTPSPALAPHPALLSVPCRARMTKSGMDTRLGCASPAGTGHCPRLLPGHDGTSQSLTSLWTVRAARDPWLPQNSANSTCKVTLPSPSARGDMVVAGHSTRPSPGGHSPCQQLAVLAGGHLPAPCL